MAKVSNKIIQGLKLQLYNHRNLLTELMNDTELPDKYFKRIYRYLRITSNKCEDLLNG